MGDLEVRRFLTDLAEKQSVSASTQNPSAERFGFPVSGGTPVAAREDAGLRSGEASENLPIVPAKGEVQSVLKHMEGVPRLVALLLYGSGLRLLECLTLRVKNLDFERMETRVR